MSKLPAILLLIAVLLCVSLLRNNSHIPDSRRSQEVTDNNTSTNSNEVLLKNVAIEAVMPFIHVDLLHQSFITEFFFFPSFNLEYHLIPAPRYINKYLKNLFLFIISSNAP